MNSFVHVHTFISNQIPIRIHTEKERKKIWKMYRKLNIEIFTNFKFVQFYSYAIFVRNIICRHIHIVIFLSFIHTNQTKPTYTNTKKKILFTIKSRIYIYTTLFHTRERYGENKKSKTQYSGKNLFHIKWKKNMKRLIPQFD